MTAQHLYNSLQLFLFYGLLSFAFYLSSVGCRHFNFAVGAAFLLGPYSALAFQVLTHNLLLSTLLALSICAVAGFLYRELSVLLFRRGSRSGQLLIISLAILGIVENVLSISFGPTSRTLWSYQPSDLLLTQATVNVTLQQVVFITAGGTIMLSFLWLWKSSMVGKTLRAMLDSRLGLMLRGYSVYRLEILCSIAGFVVAGTAGVLRAMEVSIKPTMGMEAPVIGVVAYIAGPMLGKGLFGLALASLGMVLVRLLTTTSFEQDWGMTSNLLLLLGVLTFYRARLWVREMLY